MSTSIPATLATCFLAAAEKYDLPVGLLEAVGFVESSYNAQAISYDTNGTYSVGVMQINSSWLDDLAKFGIDETHSWMPCTNIEGGAWILAQEAAPEATPYAPLVFGNISPY